MKLEMSLTDYWKVIQHRWKLIVSTIVLSVLITGLISYFVLEPEYEATATILVQSQSADEKVVYNDLLANQKLVHTYSEILKSRQIAEDVIQSLSLNSSAESLLSKVRITAVNDSLVTRIIATDNDPKQAVLIANGFAKSFHKKLNTIMKVDNVSILDEAKLAANPVPAHPKPMNNMAIAFSLALVLSVLVALLLESLDKTVKSEDEIENLLGVPVLGVIAKMDEDEQRGKRKDVSVGGAVREV